MATCLTCGGRLKETKRGKVTVIECLKCGASVELVDTAHPPKDTRRGRRYE